MKFIVLLCTLSLYMYAISLGETLFNGNCVTCHTIGTPSAAPKKPSNAGCFCCIHGKMGSKTGC
jgi:cytochrome c2